MFRSAVTSVLSALLLAACAPTPSPSPGSSAIPSALPSASPSVAQATPSASPSASPPSAGVVSAWPLTIVSERGLEPIFGPDGTAYLVTGGRDAQLIALDRAGYMKPGWPIDVRPGAELGSPAVGPDGSVYFEECAGSPVECVLHRLDGTGRAETGWPIDVPADFACSAGGCRPNAVHVGPDGTAVVSHWRDAGGLQFLGVDSTARPRPGWRIVPDITGGLWWSDVQFGPDGTLFMLGMPDGGSDLRTRIAAYGPDGNLRPGWPVAVPGRSEYVLGPRGTVVVRSFVDDTGELCNNPRRTVFTVLGADGRTLPGWPRGSTGYASRPVVDSEGTVYYVSATYRVYAHDVAGEVRTGWPVAAPGADDGCGPERPSVAPDGTLVVVGDEVTALSPDGRLRPGWPYRPAGSLSGPCFDSECYGGHGAPAFGQDGTVYLVVYHEDQAGIRAEVVALDPQGRVKPGWPYGLPFDAGTISVGRTTVSPDGRLIVGAGGSSPYVLLALDSDGQLSR